MVYCKQFIKYGFLQWNSTRKVNASLAFGSRKSWIFPQELWFWWVSAKQSGLWGWVKVWVPSSAVAAWASWFWAYHAPQHCDVYTSHTPLPLETWTEWASYPHTCISQPGWAFYAMVHFTVTDKPTVSVLMIKGKEKGKRKGKGFSFSKALLRLLEIFWWVEGSGTSIQLCLAQKPGCFLQ